MTPIIRFLAYALAFLVPLEQVVLLTTGIDTPLKPYRAVGFLFIVVWLMSVVGERVRLRWHREDTMLLIIFLWGGILAAGFYFIGGEPASHTLRTAQLIFFGLTVYVALKSTAFDRRHVAPILGAYALGVVASVLVPSILEPGVGGRLRGAYTNPNQLGHALSVAILFLLYLIIRRQGLARWVGVMTAPLALAALILTGSRAAMVGLAAGLAAGVLLVPGGKRARVKFAGAAAIAGLAATGLLVQSQLLANLEAVMPRFNPQSLSTAAGRFDIWRSALAVGADHGFLGVGMARYVEYHLEYIGRFDAYITVRLFALSTHSDFVALLVEYGLPALLLYMGILAGIARRLVRAVRQNTDSLIVVMVAAVLAATVVQGAARLSFIISDFWLVLALSFMVVHSPPLAGSRMRLIGAERRTEREAPHHARGLSRSGRLF